MFFVPDQLVCPALERAAAGVEHVERAEFRLLLARLVHMLQALERQHGGAHIARLAVPDQLHLAPVLEQDEAVFLRQRFALLNEFDEVALFGVAQLVGAVARGQGSADRVHWAGAARLATSRMASSMAVTSGAICSSGMASARPW